MKSYGVTMVELGWLVGADYNPRVMPDEEMGKLVRSVREFGLVEPVVARAEDGLVVGGHQRVAAMRIICEQDGMAIDQVQKYLVPAVLVAGLDDDRAKALNLALNRIGGEWDYTKLANLFETMGESALEFSGFSGFEVSDTMALLGSGAELRQPPRDRDDIDVDAVLATKARTMTFQVATSEEAVMVQDVLRKCGMGGPSSAAAALVKMARLADAMMVDGTGGGV